MNDINDTNKGARWLNFLPLIQMTTIETKALKLLVVWTTNKIKVTTKTYLSLEPRSCLQLDDLLCKLVCLYLHAVHLLQQACFLPALIHSNFRQNSSFLIAPPILIRNESRERILKTPCLGWPKNPSAFLWMLGMVLSLLIFPYLVYHLNFLFLHSHWNLHIKPTKVKAKLP